MQITNDISVTTTVPNYWSELSPKIVYNIPNVLLDSTTVVIQKIHFNMTEIRRQRLIFDIVTSDKPVYFGILCKIRDYF